MEVTCSAREREVREERSVLEASAALLTLDAAIDGRRRLTRVLPLPDVAAHVAQAVVAAETLAGARGPCHRRRAPIPPLAAVANAAVIVRAVRIDSNVVLRARDEPAIDLGFVDRPRIGRDRSAIGEAAKL